MIHRIGLFADISSLYYCCGKKFDGRKLDYVKYLDLIKSKGDIIRAIAYGAQRENEAQSFITCLRHIGYEPKYKKPKIYASGDGREIRRVDWAVGIAIDAFQIMDRIDMAIFGSADAALAPLIEFLGKRGIRCGVIACGINRELKQLAHFYEEIDESVLEDVPQEDEAVE